MLRKLAGILPNKCGIVMVLVTAQALAAASLADDPAWQALIHVSGEVSDPAFYLSAVGRVDADAEWQANWQAAQHDATYPCRFPARWHWLRQQQPLTSDVSCAELENWKQKLAADHVTLLFPSMYLNNPASMFGHTFLRLDKPGQSPLLAYTLSYAAKPDPQDSLPLYLYRGVFGGYAGVFAVQPYYQTVNDYGDIEQRDIWEYSLNLTPAEIDQLLNHVWELRDKKLDYFFLRENCALQLLNLLEVARPGLNLTQEFSLTAIPADTVKQVQAAGLVEHAVYRPARGSRIAQMQAQLELASELSAPQQLARDLELTAEIKQFKHQPADVELQQRSVLAVDANWLPFSAPDPVASHDSARVMLGYGNQDHVHYAEAEIRPALHDYLDNAAGLIAGSSLEILATRLRYYPAAQRTQIQELKIFGMQSYVPLQSWNTPLSFELATGMARQQEQAAYYVDGGAGLSAIWRSAHFFMLGHGLLETLPDRAESAAVFLGVHSGVILPLGSGQMVLETNWMHSVAGYQENRSQIRVAYQYDFSRRYALRMQANWFEFDVAVMRDAQLMWVVYF